MQLFLSAYLQFCMISNGGRGVVKEGVGEGKGTVDRQIFFLVNVRHSTIRIKIVYTTLLPQ